MIKYIFIIVISVMLSIGAIFLIFQEPDLRFGAFTTLNSTDSLVDFPTTYNANLVKTIEVGTTSVASITTLPALATIGTINTGVWQGTTITSTNGGTGSSTLTANMLLIGNGSNAVQSTVEAGTSGQFLTSQGKGVLPKWTTAAIDEAGNYTWTGSHSWTANSTSTAQLIFNGNSYIWPVNYSASSSVLVNDGGGGLNWGGDSFQPGTAFEDIGITLTSAGAGASTTVTRTIERNSLHVGGQLIVSAMATSSLKQGGGAEESLYEMGVSLGGTATATCGYTLFQGSDNPGATTTFRFVIRADSLTKQSLSCGVAGSGSNSGINRMDARNLLDSTTATVDLTNAQTLLIEPAAANNTSGGTLKFSVFGITKQIMNPR